ncbi:putative quinol monooxygenase [Qipengyuania sp. RANM35]|uniref:putative quinol monooxygenase n=1 Tax=Qipengyuania sp. RANM35 TaxID=3068635 RepID=UPI0034DB0150
MLLIVGTFRLPPENLTSARQAMRSMVDASRAEPGCLQYDYAEDLFDPGLIHVIERWVDRSALDAHFASDHIRAWRDSWVDHAIGQRNLVLFETDELKAI